MREKYILKVLSAGDYDKIANKYPLSVRDRIYNSKGFTDMNRNVSFIRDIDDKSEMAGTAMHEILEFVSDISPHEEMMLRFKGKKYEQPQPPVYQLPSWTSGMPAEIANYIRQGVGKTITEPSEYATVSQALQQLLGYTPEQFQYPMTDIQKALESQQTIQYQDYLNRIRPTMAQQGQLDSSYYTNLLSDYTRGQQAQTYGTTADLLTQQALQNLQLGTWLPQFKSAIAGQLQGLGGARAGIQEYNLQYPYQSYIPSLSSLYGTGMQQGNLEYQSAMNQYQAALNEYTQKMAQKAAKWQSLGFLGGPTTLAFSPEQFQGDVLAGNVDMLKTILPFLGGMGGGAGTGMGNFGYSAYNPPPADMSSLYNRPFSQAYPSMYQNWGLR